MLSNSKNSLTSHPQIWFVDVNEAGHLVEKIQINQLHLTGLARYHTMISAKKKRQFLQSRWLIIQAINHKLSTVNEFEHIREMPGHAPIIQPLAENNYHYSLSHSNKWIVFAISDDRIGIDIEYKKNRSNAAEMAEEFMSAAEFSSFKINPDLSEFYRLWCYKEAFYKSLSNKAQRQIRFAEIDSAKENAFQKRHRHEMISNEYQLTLYSACELQQVDCFVIGSTFNSPPFHTTTQEISTLWQSISVN